MNLSFLKYIAKLTDTIKRFWKIGILIITLVAIPLTVFLVTKTQIFRSRATSTPLVFEGDGVTFQNGQYYTSTTTGIKLKLTSPFVNTGSTTSNSETTTSSNFYGKNISFLKLFGQSKITEVVRNAATGHKIYHAAGVIVDKSSSPNKIYEVDSGNNRILGFNGIGYCSQASSQSCTIDSDCGTGNACRVDGSKNADIVFGQADFESGACNKDDNLGINKQPNASSLCLMGYPIATNTAEAWQRDNIEVDNEGNLYVPDYWNNRILKYNQPFSQDKSGGKGDAVADFVWGQNDFSSNGINQIKPYYDSSVRTPTNKSLWISFGFSTSDHVSSRGVSVDAQQNLWVADTFNNRVLRFPKDSQAADLVLGQTNFSSSGCTSNGPLNKFCTPTLARVDPESGDLYVSDEYPNSFRARILVFHAPFTNGMTAYKSIVINQGPLWYNGSYLFQSTGFTFNPFKEGEYAAGKLWINELSASRTTLVDGNGNVVKVIGATTNTGRGGDSQYGSECGDINNSNPFNLWWPGGSIGFDSANNIYLADEHFNRVSRYQLPYQLRTVGNKTCLPIANGGLFPGSGVNIRQNNKLGESIGLVVNNNQLIIKDEVSIKVWNDYLTKPVGSNPDIVLTGGMPTRILFSDAVDENNRLWMYNEWGDLRVYQLPFKGNDTPLADSIKLYWKDDETAVNLHLWETGLTVDKINKAIYLSDKDNNRVLRVSNYNEFLNHIADKLLVDMVIGQPDKNTIKCNHNQDQPWLASGNPTADSLCSPYGLKFDKTGNLFLIENTYECHGNDRISIFTAADLKNASSLFPMLQAKKVLIANSLTEKGPCAYATTDQPGSPVSLAFDSHNHLVVGNDGYYGNNQERQLKQLWYYADPLNKPTPDHAIELPIGSVGDMTFDSADNLFIQDHTWYRVWGINYYQDSAWGITETTPTPTASPTTTPTSPLSKNVGVLIIKYLPLDSSGTKLDSAITGTNELLSSMRTKIDNFNTQAISKLTTASRYHGYKDTSAPAAINYSVIDTKEFLAALPVSTNQIPWNPNWYRPDYKKILNDLNICDYVDNKNVKQVWLWGYHYGNIEPVESDMSMGSSSRSFWNHGTYGNISNSEQINDMPLCNKTYVLYNYNFTRGLGEMLEDHGHYLESVMNFVDSNLWQNKFVNPHGAGGTTINHCGWTHSSPNVTDAQQYNWQSETIIKSDCEDWKPDGGGVVKDVSCHTWYGTTCLYNGGVEFKVWWMQNIPGINSNLTYGGKRLRNWWDFYADIDQALAQGKTLITTSNESLTPTPTPTATPTPTSTPTSTPTPTPTTLSASISGPTSGGMNDSLTFTATAIGSNLLNKKVVIYAAKTTPPENLFNESYWGKLTDNPPCGEGNSCTATFTFTPAINAPNWWPGIPNLIVVNVLDSNNKIICSGNTVATGYPNCGSNDSVILTVNNSQVKGVSTAAAAGATIGFKIAKNPTDLPNAQTQVFTSDPMILDFNFDKPNPPAGYSETVFVQFINNNGQTENRQATITYQPSLTSTSTQITTTSTTNFFLPSITQEIKVGDEIKIPVYANVNEDSNLFTAYLNFPADLLQVSQIDLKPDITFIKNWMEHSFDNIKGIITLTGAVPDPGFKTPTGTNNNLMAEIVFKVTKIGQANISFTPDSAIYRNLDNINILGNSTGTTLLVPGTSAAIKIIPSITTIPTPTPTPTSILIVSGLKGDSDNNGKLDLGDMSVLLSKFNQSGSNISSADFNGDRKINSLDYAIMLNMLTKAGVIHTSK